MGFSLGQNGLAKQTSAIQRHGTALRLYDTAHLRKSHSPEVLYDDNGSGIMTDPNMSGSRIRAEKSIASVSFQLESIIPTVQSAY